MTKQQHQPTSEAIGVPYDSERAQRGLDLYDAIMRGDHDPFLDQIEQAAKSRQRIDRSGRTIRPPAGIETAPADQQIRHGHYSRPYDDTMRMLLEAVHNRRVARKIQRLQAAALTLRVGDRVRISPDAPLTDKHKLLLGKPGTYKRALKTNVVVDLDPDPAIPDRMRQVRLAPWMLEKILDPAKVAIVLDADDTARQAVRDATGRVRVRHGARLGWAPLAPIVWDDDQPTT
jgi:hypothetical protein